jgi:hypothetical protein
LVISSLIGFQAFRLWAEQSAKKTKIKNGQHARPLHNAISPRNEGCAGLGGRICRVVKSLQILSHNHTYQYTQMVNAPAGGRQAQPGVATGQSHLAWRLGYAEVFNDEKSHRPAALPRVV